MGKALREAEIEATGEARGEANREATAQASREANREAAWEARREASREASGQASREADREAKEEALGEPLPEALFSAPWVLISQVPGGPWSSRMADGGQRMATSCPSSPLSCAECRPGSGLESEYPPVRTGQQFWSRRAAISLRSGTWNAGHTNGRHRTGSA